MFEIAGMRFSQRVFLALSIVSLAALLGACVHSSPPDPGGSKSWVVENVASKSTAELYADVIKPGVFERSSSKVIDGYTVESGNLRMPDKSLGSLVTVRSADGRLTALVERTGLRGLLVINKQGEKTFTPDRASVNLRNDVEVNAAEERKLPNSRSQTKDSVIVDMLIGYSRSAVTSVGGDATSHALALVESANLALRQSLVTSVSLKLVGVQIVEQNYPITGDVLDNLQNVFSEGVRAFGPDMLYAVFSGHPDDVSAGLAYMPGRLAMSLPEAWMFRHEIGHNAGGLHCPSEPGAPVPYGHGYNNGKSNTAQCGEEGVYYSTPAVIDQFGLPKGDAATADMARVWRENAERLSSYYSVAAPTNFKKTGSTLTKVTFGWSPSSEAVRYDMYRTVLSGTEVVKIAETTNLTHTVSDTSGKTIYYVKAVNAIGKESNLSNGASR
ncbi:hypothetical protein [Pseudomonas sp. NPDC086251]|jgi:hypothetical protein|uniref:hypothetical protein n=1 Tax=Pseudomonas sp. NPDC086251 TaxID=3364431 RepID=UPI00383274ED